MLSKIYRKYNWKRKNVQIDAAPPAPTGEKATCPRCKSRLEVRKGPTGWFLGCTRYPMCKGTKQL